MIASPVIHELRFENVGFQYDEHPIFQRLSLDLPLETNVFITGPLGGGQSTLLKILAGLLEPNTGSYFISGRNTSEMSFEDFLPWRLQIGYSFDYGGLFANRSLQENLILPLLYHRRMEREAAEDFALHLSRQFGFERQRHQRPAAVSGGLRKLLCVLRAFVLEPPMMVMDDPFTGIGSETSRKLVDMIKERRADGRLKHVFLTSRDEVWPHWLGCDSLIVNGDDVHLESRRAAA